jgi:hypothetical protein
VPTCSADSQRETGSARVLGLDREQVARGLDHIGRWRSRETLSGQTRL